MRIADKIAEQMRVDAIDIVMDIDGGILEEYGKDLRPSESMDDIRNSLEWAPDLFEMIYVRQRDRVVRGFRLKEQEPTS